MELVFSELFGLCVGIRGFLEKVFRFFNRKIISGCRVSENIR